MINHFNLETMWYVGLVENVDKFINSSLGQELLKDHVLDRSVPVSSKQPCEDLWIARKVLHSASIGRESLVRSFKRL